MYARIYSSVSTLSHFAFIDTPTQRPSKRVNTFLQYVEISSLKAGSLTQQMYTVVISLLPFLLLGFSYFISRARLPHMQDRLLPKTIVIGLMKYKQDRAFSRMIMVAVRPFSCVERSGFARLKTGGWKSN